MMSASTKQTDVSPNNADEEMPIEIKDEEEKEEVKQAEFVATTPPTKLS